MPSVRDGRELTGLSRKNVAVEELFRSERGALGSFGGALNWKNSYSADEGRPCQSQIIERAEELHTTSHCP